MRLLRKRKLCPGLEMGQLTSSVGTMRLEIEVHPQKLTSRQHSLVPIIPRSRLSPARCAVSLVSQKTQLLAEETQPSSPFKSLPLTSFNNNDFSQHSYSLSWPLKGAHDLAPFAMGDAASSPQHDVDQMSNAFAAMNDGHIPINATQAERIKLVELKIEKTTSVGLQKELQFRIENEKIQGD